MEEYTGTQQRQGSTASRTDDELLNIALSEADGDLVWDAISTLHLRGGRDICEAARVLCSSEHVHERRVGADILGQLGVPTDLFLAESVTVLLDMLAREQDPQVLYSIGMALGHRHDSRAIESLVKLKDHPDYKVRFGVVLGLSAHENELAIQAMIKLSTDVEVLVRDWATFGLGTRIDRR